MPSTVVLPIAPLDPHDFAVYGSVLFPQGPRDAGRDGYDIWIQPFRPDTAPRLQIVRYHPRPPLVARIERHLHVTEARAPIAGPPAIIVVAPPSEMPPDPGSLRAFRLDGRGVMLHRGTWHAVDAYPEREEPADFLFLSEEATVSELFDRPGQMPLRTQTHDYRALGIEIRIAL